MAATKVQPPDALADAAIHQQWISMYRTPEAQQFYETAFDEIARRVAAPRDATILDAGCGSCAKSVLLAARGFTVVGNDFSQDALALAGNTLRAHGVEHRITLKQGDLLNLPFESGQFKYVICWGVLMHVPEVKRALSELARVLAPGGVLILSEGNMNSAQSIALRAVKRVIGRNRGIVRRTDSGLEVSEATDRGALLTRQTDMAWLTRYCGELGLVARDRFAGQLTELYVLAPWRWLRRSIHALNDVWFRYVGLPGPAFGNILLFEKRS